MKRLMFLIIVSFLFVSCSEENNFFIVIDGGGQDDSGGDPDESIVLTFDTLPQELPLYNMSSQHALIDYRGFSWDNDGIAGGWGFGVYNTSNSTPQSGSIYVMNRHGKNFLGITFERSVQFEGAYFAKAAKNAGMSVFDPGAFSANRIRLHYFDANLALIRVSNWLVLGAQPKLIAADIIVFRIVVEHDIDNPLNNPSFGISDAEWYSMDNLTYMKIK